MDDDCDIRDTLKELLEEDGYLVASAGNGLEAIAFLEQAATLPALILLDVMMPLMNGIQFCVERRKNSSWSRVPLIVMSATSRDELRSDLELDCEVYLRKPLELAALLELLSLQIGARPGNLNDPNDPGARQDRRFKE